MKMGDMIDLWKGRALSRYKDDSYIITAPWPVGSLAFRHIKLLERVG